MLSHFSRVQVCVTPEMAAHQAPPPLWDSPGKNTGVGCHFLLQCMKVKKVKSLSHVQLLATPWTAVFQAPLSMGFSRQQYWNVLPLPSPSNIYIWANAQNFQALISDESAEAKARTQLSYHPLS